MQTPKDVSDGDKRLTYYSSYPYASDKYLYVLNASEDLEEIGSMVMGQDIGCEFPI